MTATWYGVKTIYRAKPVGRPRNPDKDFDPSLSMVEERVVLVRARTFDAAIRKAEREAVRYAERVTLIPNAYGQRVKWRYLRVAHAFELAEPPEAGMEVWSHTRIVPREQSDGAVVAALCGPAKERASVRKNFVF